MQRCGLFFGGVVAGVLAFAQGCGGCDPIEGSPPARRETDFAPSIAFREVGEQIAVVLEVFCDDCDADESYDVSVEVPHAAPVRLISAKQSVDSESPVQGVTLGTEGSRIRMKAPSAGAGGRVDLVFACENVGDAVVESLFTGDTVRRSLNVFCAAPKPRVDAGSRAIAKEFANGVGELVTVSRSGPGWIFTTGGVTTNLGLRTPELAAKFTPVGDDCERFEGATDFPSEKGPDKLDAETSLQSGAATFDPVQRRYAWSGFTAGPLFGIGDALVARWPGFEESIPAPPPFGAPDTVLSAPAGARTKFYVPEGEADVVTVFGQLGAGAGYTCRFPIQSLPMDGGRRVAPLVPEPIEFVVPSMMEILQNVFVAKTRERRTKNLFPGTEVAFDAARMLRIPRSALDP